MRRTAIAVALSVPALAPINFGLFCHGMNVFERREQAEYVGSPSVQRGICARQGQDATMSAAFSLAGPISTAASLIIDAINDFPLGFEWNVRVCKGSAP